MFVLCVGTVRVAAACRGPKAERARRRVAKVAPLKEEPNRRTKQSVALQANALPRPFRRRNAARQAGSVSWYAPVGALVDRASASRRQYAAFVAALTVMRINDKICITKTIHKGDSHGNGSFDLSRRERFHRGNTSLF